MNAQQIVETLARLTDPAELETDDSTETLSSLIQAARATLTAEPDLYAKVAGDAPHIFEHETPAFRAFLRNIDTLPEAMIRKALKFVIDDLYGAGDGDEDSPRYLDPDKEWSGDTATEVRESLGSLIDTPDRDPDAECLDCGPMCTCQRHRCPNAARALIEWCDVCGAELTETGTCLNDHLEEDEGDEPSGYCGTCGEKL